MIESKFKVKGDVEIVMKYLRESDRVLRTRYMAIVHTYLAVGAAFKLGLKGGVGVEGGVSG